MPLVCTDAPAAKPVADRRTAGDTVYDAMVPALNVPKDDRFPVIAEHSPDRLLVDPNYLGIRRSANAVVVQVTLNEGRTLDAKKAFYRAVTDGLQQHVGLRREDALLSLVEARKAKWSFANGEAPYALCGTGLPCRRPVIRAARPVDHDSTGRAALFSRWA